MKRLSLIIIAILNLLALTPIAFANEDAPPRLQIDFGSLLNDPQEEEEDAPPEFGVDFGDEQQNNDQENGGGVGISINSHRANPRIFNPLIQDTTITYEISDDARVTVKVLTSSGQTVSTLIDNQAQSRGEYSVKWRGTDNNERNGNVVANGEYRYKITTSNPTTSVITDSKEGAIVVSYSSGSNNDPNRNIPPVETNDHNGQAAAIMATQNRTSGQTSDTGPGVLLYALLPVAGFISARRRKG